MNVNTSPGRRRPSLRKVFAYGVDDDARHDGDDDVKWRQQVCVCVMCVFVCVFSHNELIICASISVAV